MKTIYGTEYLYNSANLAAFANLPLRSQDKKVILEQWQSLTEVQNVPGWYLVEREISNVWNAVVFENGKLYDRVDHASVLSNREIMRRMREFGFAGSNGVLKPYPLYTVEDIEAWKEGGS
jgi:hypothetical protein